MKKEIEAGRELDAEVAFKVMRFGSESICRRTAQKWMCQCGSCDQVAFYSTEISDAWLVVENLRSQGRDIAIECFSDVPNCFRATIDMSMSLEGNAPTAPLAICRAALKAMEKRNETVR